MIDKKEVVPGSRFLIGKHVRQVDRVFELRHVPMVAWSYVGFKPRGAHGNNGDMELVGFCARARKIEGKK